MPEVVRHITIEAPIERVFALFWPDRLGDWYRSADEMRVSQINEGALRTGSRLRFESARERITVEIGDLAPPTRLAWRSVQGRFSAVTFLLMAAGDVTHVQAVESYRPHNLIARLFARQIVQRIMREALEEDLEALRELAAPLPDHDDLSGSTADSVSLPPSNLPST